MSKSDLERKKSISTEEVGREVRLKQGFRLFKLDGDEIGHVKASAPGMMRILVRELGADVEHCLDYGDFASLNDAVATVGDLYGPEKTVFVCYNAKGSEIWSERYIVAAEITETKRVGVEDLDPAELKKASIGRVKIFISGVSTEAPGGSPPNLYGEVESAQEAFSLIAENYGSKIEGVLFFFSFYDDKGKCIFEGSQLDVLEYVKGEKPSGNI